MSIQSNDAIEAAVKIAALERKLAAVKAACSDDQRQLAESILRSMDEEAANLTPRFNEAERDIILQGLQLLLLQNGVNRTTVSEVIGTVMMMHVTKRATDSSNGQI